MNIIKLKGLVLREANSGEADKIITVLTKENGKKIIAAKGAKRPKSPYIAGTQQFSYCNFIVYDNKNISNLNQVEVIEPFYNIRNDLTKLSYAVFFMELVENIIMENLPCEEILKLSLKVLQILNKKQFNFKLLSIIYQIRIMKISGYMPQTTQCVNCGKNLNSTIYFSANLGGVLCENCNRIVHESIKISLSSLHTLQYIIFSDLKDLFKFYVSDKILQELDILTKNYIYMHIDYKFKTLEFLEQINTYSK